MEFKSISLTRDLPVSMVNIENKTRSNLFTWRGQFSPQLIESILCNYADDKSVVFDPFLGSGTVLFESALLGLSASGCEINPAAVSFAKIYELVNKPVKGINQALAKIEILVSKYTNDLPLFVVENIKNFEPELIEMYSGESDEITRTVLFALITGLDFDAKKTDVKRVLNVWGTLRANIENLPRSKKYIQCFHRDSRATAISKNTVDFVVTSPPYINVFNYHQNYRKSVEKTGADILSVAKSEIGANRKFRQNRFLTVVQYCMDMSQVFCELIRICKGDAKVIFIVGRESNVRKTAFKNAKLIADVAESCGFILKGEQERVFTNKFGESIYEEILRFSISNNEVLNAIEAAREIGRRALKEALLRCSSEVEAEIKEAIEKSTKIDVSPILNVKEK